jgi:hypothetical protein
VRFGLLLVQFTRPIQCHARLRTHTRDNRFREKLLVVNGHKSLDDYISHIVVQNIEMEIKQDDIDIDSEKVF